MKSNASIVYNFFLIIGDFLALICAFIGGFILRVTLDTRPLVEAVPARTYLGIFLTLLPFWIIIFALLGLYNANIYEKRFTEIGRLFVGSFIGLLFVIFWNFLSVDPIFPAKLVPIYGFVLGFFFLVLFRNMARAFRSALFKNRVGLTNILIVGNTSTTRELVVSLIDSRHSGYKVLGVVGTSAKLSKLFPDLPFFSSFKQAVEQLGEDSIHSIL